MTVSWHTLYPSTRPVWPARLLVDGRTAFGTYSPADHTVRVVDPAADSRLPELASFLGEGELVAYRPGRRATVRRTSSGHGVEYVKVIRPSAASDLLARMQRVREATRGAVRCAAVRPCGPSAVVFDEVRGSPLHEFLTTGALEEHHLATVAKALGRFHSREVEPQPGREPRTLERWVDLVRRYDPEPDDGFLGALEGSLEAMPPAAPHPWRMIHGDLHDKNLLIDGDTVGLIDFDESRAGDPAEDVGNLAAHFVLRSLQAGEPGTHGWDRAAALIEAYGASGERIPSADIGDHMARALLRLACVYRFRRPWAGLSRELALLARAAVDSDHAVAVTLT